MLICTRKSGCMKLGGHNGDCEVQSRGEYTPTTDEMRFAWAERVNKHDQEGSDEFDRWLVEVERAAAARAWDALAEAAYPLYEAAEAVLLHGADRKTMLEPLGRLGAQSNPYRAAELRERKSE